MTASVSAADRPWFSAYPNGVPADVDASPYRSLVGLMEASFRELRGRPAYSFHGAHLQLRRNRPALPGICRLPAKQGAAPGDRVAVMMPNVPQYPIVVAAILRAGCVVVNVNPLYTARELEHQLKDSGAKAIVIIENLRQHAGAVCEHHPGQAHCAVRHGRHAGLAQGHAGQCGGAAPQEAGAAL
jgi:long-chain acyl-CoA synthetase